MRVGGLNPLTRLNYKIKSAHAVTTLKAGASKRFIHSSFNAFAEESQNKLKEESFRQKDSEDRRSDLSSAEELNLFLKDNLEHYSIKKGTEPKDFPQAKYLGKYGQPFPLNPLFKHAVPLSESKKNELFKLFLNDPKKNTPRVLATAFKISIRRAEAILKLKHLELDMIKNKGFKPLLNFETGMSKILGANDKREIEELEPINPKLGKPDAACALGREEFTQLTEEILTSKPFSYHGLSGKDNFVDPEPTPAPIATDPILGSHKKFNYIFSDINPNLPLSERVVLIREKNGILRKATKLEGAQQARRTDWPLQEKLFRRTNNLALKPKRVPSTLNP
ncbi:hypothetical protein DSO57_1007952 [Entomophthora muscae]|uniref:Uncharacterized protein n=1 Tax=Entomophthora muscae TaxID=34485 RepID=A0ACC2SW39_9FUNG|nr:hypothetical protein DSO57_1007952 [Entomophthora muscae]